MRICTTTLALLVLASGLANPAAAKDPFGFFRGGATAKTVSKTNAAGQQEGVVQPAPETLPNPAPSPPYMPGPIAPGATDGFAPRAEYDAGPDSAGPYAPGVFSVWPGVPACCDPWLGYCQEPRHYPCAKGQGRYIYYVPPCSKEGQMCGAHFITWTHGKECGPNGACNTCGGRPVAYAGGKQCDSCVTVTDAVHQSPTPVPAPAPQRPSAPQPDSIWNSPSDQPARNELPPATTRVSKPRLTW